MSQTDRQCCVISPICGDKTSSLTGQRAEWQLLGWEGQELLDQRPELPVRSG